MNTSAITPIYTIIENATFSQQKKLPIERLNIENLEGNKTIMAIEDTNSTRVMSIRQAIEQRLQPRHIEIVDESHLHAGHAGARDGKGHFKIIISADKLDAKKPIEQHKIIYTVLKELMLTDIHALSIEVRS